MRCKVLLSRQRQEIFAAPVLMIGEHRSAQMALVVKLAGLVTIINRQDESSAKPLADLQDPVARFQSRFGLLAFCERNSLCCEVFGDRASGKRPNLFAQAIVSQADEHFLQRSAFAQDTMHRQRIEQLIRHDATKRNFSGDFAGRDTAPCIQMARQMRRMRFAPARRALHSGIFERSIKGRQSARREVQNVSRKPPVSRARFHGRKTFRLAERFPHLRKLAHQQPPEDGMHVHAGVVIAESPRFGAVVVAMPRMIQTLAHGIGKRHRPVILDPAEQQFQESCSSERVRCARHQSSARLARSRCSSFQAA